MRPAGRSSPATSARSSRTSMRWVLLLYINHHFYKYFYFLFFCIQRHTRFSYNLVQATTLNSQRTSANFSSNFVPPTLSLYELQMRRPPPLPNNNKPHHHRTRRTTTAALTFSNSWRSTSSSRWRSSPCLGCKIRCSRGLSHRTFGST